jgi:hypothetical protein
LPLVFKVVSHVASPNKGSSSGVSGIKLSEYAKSEANEDEFFIPPDELTAEREPAG